MKYLKRIVSALTAAVFSVVFLLPPAVIAGGAENEVHISSAEDLVKFASACVYDKYSKGKTFVLDCDISLSGTDLLTIPSFGGEFLGNGHTVSELIITEKGTEMGFFRHIEESGVVKDLNVKGEVVPDGSCDVCGGIAGVNRGKIINCSFGGVVSGENTIGGIAGLNEETGLISACTSGGVVRGSHFTGGIAGQNIGDIIGCENYASVNTEVNDESFSLDDLKEIGMTEQAADMTDAGGIGGFSSGTIQNCVNNGSVGYPHIGYNMGGIVGRQSGYVSGCENNGEINGRKDTGGIAGQAEPYTSIFFAEKKLDTLREQLNSLSDTLDMTITHAEERSDESSSDIDIVIDRLESVKNSADNFLDETDRVINEDVDSINEISTRISDLIEMLTPAADSLSEASDALSSALDKISSAVKTFETSMEYADKGMDDLQFLADDLSDAADKIKSASDEVSSALDSLKKAIGDPLSVQDALDRLSDGFDDMGSALGSLSRTCADGIEALSELSDKAGKYLPMVTDALKQAADGAEKLGKSFSDSSGSLRSIAYLIRSGCVDPSDYAYYLGNIADSFDASAAAEIFSAFSGLAKGIYGILSSETENDYNTVIRKRTSFSEAGKNAEEDIKDAGSAAEDIFGSVSDITGGLDALSFDKMIDGLKNADVNIGSSAEYIRSAMDSIGAASDDFDDAFLFAMAAVAQLSSASDDLSAASDKFSDSMDVVAETFDYFSNLEKVEFIGADDALADSRDLLGESSDDLLDVLKSTADGADITSDLLGEDLRSINNKARDAYNTLLDIIDDISNTSVDPEDHTDDISASDTYGRSDGKIADCRNYGSVNADVNAGGIAGSMSVELDFDPEGDLEISGERSADFMYKSKTVTRDCTNFGDVTSKKDGAGGIVGSIETGCLINCTAYGHISSEDGGMVGGAAGNSEAAVYGCKTMVRLSGNDHIGGISGTVREMTDCISFSVIDKSGEHTGMLAGTADMYSGSEIRGNVFVDPSLLTGERSAGGIDGISYEGRAFPISYEEMVNDYTVPRDFKELKLTFTADGKTVGTIGFEYGGSVSEEDVPQIPPKEGYFADWGDKELVWLTFSEEVEAVYSKYTTSLASDETRGDTKPLFIAEGKFTDRDKLQVTEEKGGYTLTIPLSDAENSEYIIRYLPEGDVKKTLLTITSDNTAVSPEVTADGSYLVFSVRGRNITVTESKKPSYILPAAVCGGCVLIIILAAAGAAKKKKRNKKK